MWGKWERRNRCKVESIKVGREEKDGRREEKGQGREGVVFKGSNSIIKKKREVRRKWKEHKLQD